MCQIRKELEELKKWENVPDNKVVWWGEMDLGNTAEGKLTQGVRLMLEPGRPETHL